LDPKILDPNFFDQIYWKNLYNKIVPILFSNAIMLLILLYSKKEIKSYKYKLLPRNLFNFNAGE